MTDLGPDSFESSPSLPREQRLRAWAEVDLGAISHNIARLKEAAAGAQLMAVVKADAYGHGLEPVAKTARIAGASWLGVALLTEALQLRRGGDTGRILSWLPTPGDAFDECVRADIDLGVGASWMLTEIAYAAASVGRTARVHLKIDTGLGRSGLTVADWGDLLKQAARLERAGSIEVVGVWSHFAYADSPDHPTIADQLQVFEDAIELARAAGIDPQLRHIANSAATLSLPEAHFDLVRPGIAVYGISPGEEVGTSQTLGLRPAMKLAARLALVKRLPAGHGVSYAHQYVTDQETTVGLVPLGYADGLPRRSSGVGPVSVRGARLNVAGRMCMDQFVVDLGDSEVNEGDEVVIFGAGDKGEPTAQDWALACETIAYEIVTCIGPRVARTYRGGS